MFVFVVETVLFALIIVVVVLKKKDLFLLNGFSNQAPWWLAVEVKGKHNNHPLLMSSEEFFPFNLLAAQATDLISIVCLFWFLCVEVHEGLKKLHINSLIISGASGSPLPPGSRTSSGRNTPTIWFLGAIVTLPQWCLPSWCYPCPTVTVLDLNASSKVIYRLESAHVQSPVLHLTRTVANVVSHSHLSMTTVTRSCFFVCLVPVGGMFQDCLDCFFALCAIRV